MSDDEGPPGKKGRKGKGGDDKGCKSKGGGGKGGGGSKGKGGGADNGISVSRLKVLPKFLQDMQSRLKPSEEKRGLDHAKLNDKSSSLGCNDDDEYDVEGATIGDGFTADDDQHFRKRKKEREALKEEAEKGPMKFVARTKADRNGPDATTSEGDVIKKPQQTEAGGNRL